MAYTYVNIPVNFGSSTYLTGINNHDVIVGYSGNTSFTYHQGTFTFLADGYFGTDINDSGEIVGVATPNVGASFLYSAGSYTTLQFPSYHFTDAYDINNLGQIVGNVIGTDEDGNGIHRGFVYDDGVLTLLNVPGASMTQAYALNDVGQVVGVYYTNNVPHGFVYNHGQYTTLDFPDGYGTILNGINNAGEIVGIYDDQGSGPDKAFVYSSGSFTKLLHPLAIQDVTDAWGINDYGKVVGGFWTGAGLAGFVASPGDNRPPTVSGRIVSISSEDAAPFEIDLLQYASDADTEDTLHVRNVTGLVSGLTLNGDKLLVDTSFFNVLPGGEQAVFNIKYLIEDNAGESVEQTAQITISGRNDVASIGGSSFGTVTEDEVITPSGHLTIVDPDTGEVAFKVETISGAYGSLAIDATGAWRYSLNNALSSVQALNAGQSVLDQLEVNSIDGTKKTIAITIRGANETLTNGNAGGLFSGTAGNDLIDGKGGVDIINAGAGHDRILGGLGSDFINAGVGDDVIVATIGDGSDLYVGGSGIDVLDMSAITAPASINLNGYASSEQTGWDVLFSIENAVGGSGGDYILGSGTANVLDGRAGNDVLRGGFGDDILIGGTGDDILDGGPGNDRLGFASGFGHDLVQSFDFNPSGGQDIIDLSAIGITASNFNSRVVISDVGPDTLVTVDGIDTILLVGIGSSESVTIDDFLLKPLPRIPLPFGNKYSDMYVSQGWGLKDPSHFGSLHYSIDFSRAGGPSGIHALSVGNNGKVYDYRDDVADDANGNSGLGNYITIKYVTSDGNDYFATYMHLKAGSITEALRAELPSALDVNLETAKAYADLDIGDAIGRVGDTGGDYDPHLHFQFSDNVMSFAGFWLADASAAKGKTYEFISRNFPYAGNNRADIPDDDPAAYSNFAGYRDDLGNSFWFI